MNLDHIPLRYKEDFLLVEDNPQLPWQLDFPYALKDYTIVTIIEQGEAVLEINGCTDCHIKERGILYHLPGQVFTTRHVSEDFACKHIMMSSDFIAHIGLDVGVGTCQLLQSNPFIPFEERGMHAIGNAYDMFAGILQQTENPHLVEVLRHLIHAYHLCFDYYYRSRMAIAQHQTREYKLTQNFFTLLREYGIRQHSVQFYANRLHLTPKYLSTCVQRATGKSAKQHIDNHIISHAQHLLTVKSKNTKTESITSQRTISEVAYELGFADPATFSRYFYTRTGLRPKEWREQKK